MDLVDTIDSAEKRYAEWSNLSKRYIEINILGTGKSFGDLALLGSKPRMASIRCLEDTHFAVLSKSNFNLVIG